MSPNFTVPCLFLFSLAASMPVSAEVYKCEGQNQQVIYSDSPCDNGHGEIITDIMVAYPDSQEDSRSRVMRQLDDAVKSALVANDLVRAKALSTTAEHRTWITEAEKEIANKPQKTETALKAEMASSTACQKAKSSLEAEANASFSNPEVLEARKSLMYTACGVIEPVVIQQHAQPNYIYGYPYRFRYNEPHHRHRHGQHNHWEREPRHQSKFPIKRSTSESFRPSRKQ